MNWIWKNYPALYALPFLMATLALEQTAQIGEVARWVVMLGAVLIPAIISPGFFRHRFKKHDLMFLAFLAVAGLSCSWSINFNYSLLRAISIGLLYLAAFWGFLSYIKKFSAVDLLKRLAGTVAVVLALNLVFAVALGYSIGIGRFQGFFSNANGVGSVSGVTLPVLFYLAITTNKWFWRGFFAITLVSLLLAGSRGPLVAALCSIAILSIPHVARFKIKIFVLGSVLLLFFAFFSRTSYFEENIVRSDTLETMSNRTYFWDLGRDYIAERPWLGFGFGTDAEIHEYHGIELKDLKLRGYGVMSSYLGLAVQIGIPFTVLFYGYFIIAVIRSAVSHWRDPQVMAYAGFTAGGLMIGIGESVIYSAGNPFAYFFWCFPVLLVHRIGEIRIKRRKRLKIMRFRKLVKTGIRLPAEG